MLKKMAFLSKLFHHAIILLKSKEPNPFFVRFLFGDLASFFIPVVIFTTFPPLLFSENTKKRGFFCEKVLT